MKRILLTGGGTGGHIYPLVAVADELRKQSGERGTIELMYLGPASPLNAEFEQRDIRIYRLASSKLRRYFSLQNAVDAIKFFISLLQTLAILYVLMPDVVFSKGGPGAFAVVLAARFYRIPVLIHESDSVPGLTNRLSVPMAARIGIAFNSAAAFFPVAKTALVGNPVRPELLDHWEAPAKVKAHLKFDPKMPLVLVLGGSQGAARINMFVLDNLAALLGEVQVYHQVGSLNLDEAVAMARLALQNLDEIVARRYRAAGFLGPVEMREALNACDVIISRAGAGAIYEIAAAGKPAILVPLDGAANDHQRKNAYEYARTGAAEVVEEANCTVNLVMAEVRRFLSRASSEDNSLARAARQFYRPNAAQDLAREILWLAGDRR